MSHGPSQGYCVVPFDFHDVELQDAVASICRDLAPHRQSFRQLRKDGGEIELSVVWYSAGTTSETVDARLLRRLGELGIDLSISVCGSA